MLKPMNCPHHIKIFASQPHSYRDLPVRLAEFGTVYRWEQSGELNGMTRVRGFTQDDAHLFCTEEQVAAEVQGCLALVKIVLTTLGMSDYRVRVGLRDPDSNKYTGNADNWDKAEAACREAAQTLGVPFTEEPGEAAFYGPKIDFVIKDVIGREWQLGTVQVDYNLPIRFDLSYIGADNQPHRPVMIHRAPFGSMERFCGVLIEHFGGDFPVWLAPEQVRLVPDQRQESGLRPRAARPVEGRRRSRGRRRAQRQAGGQDPPRRIGEGSLHSRPGRQGSGDQVGQRALPRQRRRGYVGVRRLPHPSAAGDQGPGAGGKKVSRPPRHIQPRWWNATSGRVELRVELQFAAARLPNQRARRSRTTPDEIR